MGYFHKWLGGENNAVDADGMMGVITTKAKATKHQRCQATEMVSTNHDIKLPGSSVIDTLPPYHITKVPPKFIQYQSMHQKIFPSWPVWSLGQMLLFSRQGILRHWRNRVVRKDMAEISILKHTGHLWTLRWPVKSYQVKHMFLQASMISYHKDGRSCTW